MDTTVARIEALKAELTIHGEIEAHLGVDLGRPIRSLEDGYPENAVTLSGRIVEALLKSIWISKGVKGDPASKQLRDLLNGCKDHVRDRTIRDHIAAIQSTRNRAAHDGGFVDDEDALDVLRRLAKVLDWFVATQFTFASEEVLGIDDGIASEVEFVAGLYLVLGYSLLSKSVLAPSIVHQLFGREQGLRKDYVEVVIAETPEQLEGIGQELADGLFRTDYPKAVRLVAVSTPRHADIMAPDFGEASIVSFDELPLRLINYEAYRRQAMGAPALVSPPMHAEGQMLELNPATHDYSITAVGDVRAELLDAFLARKGNVLVVGKPGSGKSQQLRWLLQGALHAHRPGIVFFFDLGTKPPEVTVEQFLADSLTDYFDVPRHLVFPLYSYLSRSGRVLNLFDGVDEAASSNSLGDFMEVFAAVSELLSAESQVVMTSRTAFLEDSMYVRELLDRDAMTHDKVITEVTSAGIDPLTLPRFRVLKLVDLEIETPAGEGRGTALEHRLLVETDADPAVSALPPGPRSSALVGSLFESSLRGTGVELSAISEFFGSAFLDGREAFSLVELFNHFGTGIFPNGLSLDACILRPVLVGLGDDRVRFRHRIFQEYLAALFLASAIDDAPPDPYITEQVREFRACLGQRAGSCEDTPVVPSGSYLVGPGDSLRICRIRRPFRVSQNVVTVEKYRQFLDVAREGQGTRWSHPMQPPDIDYEPYWDRLLIPDYYTNPSFARHPATAIDWWSATAYARWVGGRLPSTVEWEVAARGDDGRVFPWGDEPDIQLANAADYWAGRSLLGYDEWKKEIDAGGVRESRPLSVDEFPDNVSPFGARNMAGNVWEWTSTIDATASHAVMCGGSYDNPLRGTRTFSKGVYRTKGRSNVVGFRCVFEVSHE